MRQVEETSLSEIVNNARKEAAKESTTEAKESFQDSVTYLDNLLTNSSSNSRA